MKGPQSAEEAIAGGNNVMTDFFRRKKKGRPKKKKRQCETGGLDFKLAKKSKKKRRGPVPGTKSPPTANTKKAAPVTVEKLVLAPAKPQVKKQSRTNWSAGEGSRISQPP